jgi:23S rRNA maturation-related 3'-5' exoribonuclease YhaM
MSVQENKEKIIKLLKSTKKEGIENLINYLEKNNFFISKASFSYHGNYEGGLAEHCLSIYNLYNKLYSNLFKLNFEEIKNEIIIASFLHDLCKLDYGLSGGHASRSLKIIGDFIILNPLEENLIKYHMGMYKLDKEYSYSELEYAFNDKRIKLFYFCDDLSAQFLEVKK